MISVNLSHGFFQDAQQSVNFEAQWLDLIRSAVQEQVRGECELCGEMIHKETGVIIGLFYGFS
jgi:hypothetical protein